MVNEVRIVEIKPFKAVVSGLLGFDVVFGKTFGDLVPTKNQLFIKEHFVSGRDFFQVSCPHNFTLCPACGEKCQMKGQFIFPVMDSVTEKDAAPYELITFAGGLFAVGTAIDENEESSGMVLDNINNWLGTSGFEDDYDSSRLRMCMMLNQSDEIKAALGYAQQDLYVPIKFVDYKFEAALTLTSYTEGGQITDADYARVKAAPAKSVIRIHVGNVHRAKEDRSHWGCGRIGNSNNSGADDGVEFKGAPAGETREYRIPVAGMKGPFTNVYNDCKINKAELWAAK